MSAIPRSAAIAVFLAFAVAYFFSALLRAITATLSPVLSHEFQLGSADLGLLAGAYFLGFSVTQLPLGSALDRYGPRRVSLLLLTVAVAGCVLFSVASSFWALVIARALIGVGVSACLMAPLTGYRRWYTPTTQLRANSWMLMTGSLGMVAATLPVQWLLPLTGWRPLFWGLAVAIAVAMAVILWLVPGWAQPSSTSGDAAPRIAPASGYGPIWRSRYFWRMVPIGFFCYGGMVAVQTLWAVPWMMRVGGLSSQDAAHGLFWINVSMLITFWTWGLITPALARRGLKAERLIAWGLPGSFAMLASVILLGPALGPWGFAGLALFCMTCSVVSLAQPAVAMAFPSELAGRALSAYNLVIFLGVFCVQWAIGLLADTLQWLGWSPSGALRTAMALFLLLCVGSYGHFFWAGRDNRES